jgi:hypothetical protein
MKELANHIAEIVAGKAYGTVPLANVLASRFGACLNQVTVCAPNGIISRSAEASTPRYKCHDHNTNMNSKNKLLFLRHCSTFGRWNPRLRGPNL